MVYLLKVKNCRFIYQLTMLLINQCISESMIGIVIALVNSWLNLEICRNQNVDDANFLNKFCNKHLEISN